MPITFRITTAADQGMARTAKLSARQLAGLRALLRDEGARLGQALLEPDGEDLMLADHFEARVCPVALASLARVLDHGLEAIAVLEDAQFRGRRILVWRGSRSGLIHMQVARTSDLAVELDLTQPHALALLTSLGLGPAEAGAIPPHELRSRLDNPTTQVRLHHWQLDHYAPRLEQLLAHAALDDSSRVEWA